MLNDHPSEMSNEFEKYNMDEPEKKDQEGAIMSSRPPSHSLELNIILVFLYMAGRSFGIIEKDVLQAA